MFRLFIFYPCKLTRNREYFGDDVSLFLSEYRQGASLRIQKLIFRINRFNENKRAGNLKITIICICRSTFFKSFERCFIISLHGVSIEFKQKYHKRLFFGEGGEK